MVKDVHGLQAVSEVQFFQPEIHPYLQPDCCCVSRNMNKGDDAEPRSQWRAARARKVCGLRLVLGDIADEF